MELGNMLFGNSRGAVPIDRNKFQSAEPLGPLWQELWDWADYNESFSNDLFTISPYWWGDEEAPQAELPNFVYKPTGYEIRWYKYPFRDSYANREISDQDALDMVRACVASVRKL